MQKTATLKDVIKRLDQEQLFGAATLHLLAAQRLMTLKTTGILIYVEDLMAYCPTADTMLDTGDTLLLTGKAATQFYRFNFTDKCANLRQESIGKLIIYKISPLFVKRLI